MSSESKIHRVKLIECPVCGSALNAAHGVNHAEEPQENDISICGYCTTVMVFDKNAKARVISDNEISIIKMVNSSLWDQVNETIERLNKKKGNPAKLFTE